MADPSERVREVVEPFLTAEGLELVDVEASARLVRVTLDREGGIDLDTISDVSRRVSALLDHHDPLPGGGSYALEVSSPGLERPLRTPAHFRRFVGSTVSVKTKPDVEGERRVQGELVTADDAGFTVRSDDDGRALDRRFSYDDVDKARTVFEWGPSEKPGKSRRGKKVPTS